MPLVNRLVVTTFGNDHNNQPCVHGWREQSWRPSSLAFGLSIPIAMRNVTSIEFLHVPSSTLLVEKPSPTGSISSTMPLTSRSRGPQMPGTSGRWLSARLHTLNSTLVIKAIKRTGSKKEDRCEEQLFLNKEGVAATIATHGNPELSPARKHLVEAQTLVPNTQGWGHSRRLNVTPLDNVAAIIGAISVLRVRTPESQRLEKSEPLFG